MGNAIIVATQNVRSSFTIPIFNPYDDINLKHVMPMYERQPSILTNVGGHQFHNLTNCSITLSISNPYVIATLLHSMQDTFSP
jgi:hypothetical protein